MDENIAASVLDDVHIIEYMNRQLIIIGTAHISQQSIDTVEQTIKQYNPDVVCVELDEGRFAKIQHPQVWEELNIFQVIRSRKFLFMCISLVLAAFQKKMGDQLGVRPGAELITAIDSAQQCNAQLILCDRDIAITLKRCWRSSGLWHKFQLYMQIMTSVFATESINEEQIEQMKKENELSALMGEFSKKSPIIKKVLIDERDVFMASNIIQNCGDCTVAVLGAGHVPGVKAQLEAWKIAQPDTSTLEQIRADYNNVPAASILSKLLSIILPLIVISLFVYRFSIGGFMTGISSIWMWVLINGGFSSLGVILALGHPLSIITAFVCAPITSMIPVVGAGMPVALVETFLRKPRVIDFQTIGDDMGHMRGIWRNGVLRIFLVFFFAGLGSSIGTFVALPFI